MTDQIFNYEQPSTKKLTMKQVRKERQKALTAMLNFWYRHEQFTTPKFLCFLHMIADR